MPSLRCFFGILAMVPCITVAQVILTGRTIDAHDEELLAFVNIAVEGERQGTVSDIDGRFSLGVGALPVDLRFSYVGYEPLTLHITDAGPVVVRLQRKTELLREAVVLPGENPAHRIIREVREHRKENDGMKYRAHRYRSYSKTVFTAELDTTHLHDTAWIASLDTAARETFDFFNSQHLLLIESATEKSFDPPAREQERVLAMRVSGLKDPSLLALAASTKTFDMYEPSVTLAEKQYLGPIGPNSTAHYFFLLEDTLFQDADSVFVISFRPERGSHFDGLKGLLYVNTGGYALQNVIAEPVEQTGSLSLKVQQQFARVGGKSWFPIQLNTFIGLPQVDVDGYALVGVGRTYLRDIELDVEIAKSETRGPAFDAEHMEVRREDAYWEGLRNDSLTAKELKTYHVIDSLGEAEHLDRKMKWMGAVLSGRLPIGPVDLELGRLLGYNNYEGLRLGAGLSTNGRVTRYSSVGGYFAYGTKDEQWKWGGELRIKPQPRRSLELRGYYTYDVSESGGYAFSGRRPLLSPDATYLLYADRYDRIERIGGEASFRLGGSLTTWLGSAWEHRVNELGYRYATSYDDGLVLYQREFTAGTIEAELRYAFRERIAQLPDRQLSLGTKWPVVRARLTRAVHDLWNGDQDFWRLTLMTEKSFRIRLLGTTTLRLIGGASSADAPYPWLHNLRGSNEGKVLINTPFAFETMRTNEFLADRYAALHFRHSFGSLLVGAKRFQPVPVLVSSIAFGALDQPERHDGYTFTSPEKGFFESGIELLIQQKLTTLGAGVYYRYGPNGLPDADDNLVWKLAAGYAF